MSFHSSTGLTFDIVSNKFVFVILNIVLIAADFVMYQTDTQQKLIKVIKKFYYILNFRHLTKKKSKKKN